MPALSWCYAGAFSMVLASASLGCATKVVSGGGSNGGAGGAGAGSPAGRAASTSAGTWSSSTAGAGGGPGQPATDVASSAVASSTSVATSASSGAGGAGGGPVVLVQEGGQPWDIAVDAACVYWLNTDGTVKKIPKQGGPITHLTSGVGNTGVLRQAGGSLFFSSYDAPLAVQGMPAAGGAVTVYGQGIGNGALAVDDANVYWATMPGPDTWGSGDIMVTPRFGGPVTVLLAAQWNPQWFVSDGGYLYWTEFEDADDNPPDPTPGALRRVPVTGGAVEDLLVHEDLTTFALDADTAYVSNPGTSFGNHDGSILAVPNAGGAPVTLALGITPGPLAIDATDIYFTSSVDFSVYRLSKAGGAVTTLVTTGGNPTAIALDDDAVYWVDPTLGTVNRLAK